MSLSELPCKISFAPVHSRPAASRWLAVVLVLGLLPFRLMAQETQTLSPEVLADFAAARKLAENSDNTPRSLEELNVLVRKLAPHFQTIPVIEAHGGTNHFFKVELNRHKTGFDGVRFKISPGPVRTLTCIFAIPKGVRPVRWYYTALDGTKIDGFITEASEGKQAGADYFGALYDRFVPWGKDGDDYITITQWGSSFKGEGEYVLWFSCVNEAAFPFQGAYKFPPRKLGGFDWNGVMDFHDN